MFNRIASGYDALNRVISLGLDKRWRKKIVASAASKQPKSILDLATGTGDLAIALANTGAKEIIAADLAEEMLRVANKKIKAQRLESKIKTAAADAESLPFDSARFDLITVAFGVRNFENLDTGLGEMFRVLKTGGHLLILETSVPRNFLIRQAYFLFTKVFIGFVGKLFSKDPKAYVYLSKSAEKFPHGMAFNNILKKNGFIDVSNLPQSFGVASIYYALKP